MIKHFTVSNSGRGQPVAKDVWRLLRAIRLLDLFKPSEAPCSDYLCIGGSMDYIWM
jgi:hypothetical protein